MSINYVQCCNFKQTLLMMKKIYTILALSIGFSYTSNAQTITTQEVKIGQSIVTLETKKYGNSPIFAVNLHGNESTSVDAAEIVFAETGGTIFKIVNPNRRHVGFVFKNDSVFVDPNRIYTRTGIRATLKNINTRYKSGTVREVKQLGKFIVSQIPTDATIIALHNNTEDNLSILSYMDGGAYVSDAELTHQGEHDIDDFYLTTDRKIYELLKEKGHNITLQHNKKVKNDGSMSVYYGKKNVSYINIEAQHGHLDEQVKMLQDLLQILSR